MWMFSATLSIWCTFILSFLPKENPKWFTMFFSLPSPYEVFWAEREWLAQHHPASFQGRGLGTDLGLADLSETVESLHHAGSLSLFQLGSEIRSWVRSQNTLGQGFISPLHIFCFGLKWNSSIYLSREHVNKYFWIHPHHDCLDPNLQTKQNMY